MQSVVVLLQRLFVWQVKHKDASFAGLALHTDAAL